jgi:hypothetical protein
MYRIEPAMTLGGPSRSHVKIVGPDGAYVAPQWKFEPEEAAALVKALEDAYRAGADSRKG